MKLLLKHRIIITIVITLLIWAHIVWEHFNGGIATHYLFQDDSLPGIPNWLGGIFLPFFTWFLLYRIQKRIDSTVHDEVDKHLKVALRRFFLAMIIAISISIFFTLEIDVIDYIMLAIFVLAFIFPLYKSEFLLGWVVGASYTFGAIIPMGFGSLLALIFFVLYKCSRFVINKLGKSSKDAAS